jgi:hypothetical protein
MGGGDSTALGAEGPWSCILRFKRSIAASFWAASGTLCGVLITRCLIALASGVETMRIDLGLMAGLALSL